MAEKEKLTMRQWLGRGLTQTALILNLLSFVPSALGLLAPAVSPSVWWAPSVFAMIMPWPALVPLFWALVWLVPKPKIAIVNMIVLALHWPALSLSFQFNSPLKTKSKDFTLMSFNVDAFQYKQSKLREITGFIESRRPDILCFQEYRDGLDSAGTAAQYLKKRLGYKHKAFVELIPESTYGLAFFSKYPIIRSGAVTDPGPRASNGIAYADIKLYGQTLRIYNTHLESYRFTPQVRQAVAVPPAMSLIVEKKSQQEAKNVKPSRNKDKETLGGKTAEATKNGRQAVQMRGSNAVAGKESELPPQPKTEKKKPNDKPASVAQSLSKNSAPPAPKEKSVANVGDYASTNPTYVSPLSNPSGRKRKTSSEVESPPLPMPNPPQNHNLFAPKAEVSSTGLKYYWKTVKELLRTWDKQLEQVYRLTVHRGLVQSDEFESPGGEVYTVVCGDLNNPPYGYVYRRVGEKLNDAFMERGTGWGRTYGRGLKSFRIDYIFTDPRLTVADFKILDAEGLSDHSALFARLRFGFH